MRRIFTIGETVYDVIFKNGQAVSSTAGGSMLNTSISLGRLGLPVSFISEIGMDTIGEMILQFLEHNGINTSTVYRFSEGKTALALAFLDENENADYTFYKVYPTKRLKINLPEIMPNDILLFGSFLSITEEVREPLMIVLNAAKEKGAIFIYDPNFRKPHLKELPFIKKYIHENILFADIVRGSNEDFELIFGTKNADDTFKVISKIRCPILIYTEGNKPVEVRKEGMNLSIPVPEIKLKSTIGAGDTFNSGIIYKLFSDGIEKKSIGTLSSESWRDIIDTSIKFAGKVCQSYDNFISLETAKQFR